MNSLRDYLFAVIGEDTWVQLDSIDVSRIRGDIMEIYFLASRDFLHIIWQEESGRIWERFAPYVGSVKKTLIMGIFDPNFRGSLSMQSAQDKLDCEYIPIISLEQIILSGTGV